MNPALNYAKLATTMAQVLYIDEFMAKKKIELEKSNDAPASAGMLYAVRNELSAKITSNEIAIRSLEKKMDARFDGMDARFDAMEVKLADMDAKWDAKIAAMDSKWDAKIAAMEAKWDAKIASIEAKLDEKLNRMLFFYEEQKNDNRYTRDLLVALEARQDRIENSVTEIKTLLDVDT